MINLNTPSQELLNELWDDYKKADYWLTKQLGGMKKQKELGDRLCRECLMKNKELATSDYIEYISPKGNRWIMYISSRRHGDHFYTTPLGFCYYETYGSIGALVPSQCGEGSNNNGCLIFTSHFFLRLCDRLGIKARSRVMVKRFIEYISGMVVSYRGEGTHGKHEVDVRLPASIGRGRLREDSPFVVEINTFLKDTELTKKQLKETKALRECSENVNLQTTEHLELRVKRGDGDAVLEHVKKNLLAVGHDEQSINALMNIPFVAKILSDRMCLKLEPEPVSAYVKSSLNKGGRFASWRDAIIGKHSTYEEKQEAFWGAVVDIITHFNPSVTSDEIVNEGFKLLEGLENK